MKNINQYKSSNLLFISICILFISSLNLSAQDFHTIDFDYTGIDDQPYDSRKDDLINKLALLPKKAKEEVNFLGDNLIQYQIMSDNDKINFIIQTSRIEELSIEIYDIMSKVVFESTYNKVRSGKVISINSTDMKSGNYFYRIVYKNEVISSNVLTIVK